jgi:hypothetical protein
MSFARNVGWLGLLAYLVAGAGGEAAGQVFQQGGVIPQHLTMWSTNNTVMDAGTAADRPQGLLPHELGLQAPPNKSGNPFPATATGTGPGGELACLWDSPIGTPGHYFCMSPNVGAGLASISVGSSSGGTPSSLQIVLNGTAYPFPGPPGGVLGPSTTVVGDAASWNNTSGTLLADSGVSLNGLGIPGAKGDGVTDNCAAINAAISAAGPGNPVSLSFGPGTYVSSCAITSTGRSVTVRGAGKSTSSMKFTGATDGFTLNTSLSYSVDITDITIYTTSTNTGSGVSINYTTNGYFNRENKRANLRDVRFIGFTPANQSWTQCVTFTNVNFVNVTNVDCTGSNGTAGTSGNVQADNTNTPFGFVIANNDSIHPTDYKFTNVGITSVNVGIYADNVNLEGLQIITSSIVGVGTGVHWYTGAANQGRPQITVIGNNTSTYGDAFDIKGISEGNISGNLIYHNESSTTAANMINLAGIGGMSVTYNQIESFVQNSVAPTTGIMIQSAAGYPVPASYGVTVRGNIIGAQAAAGTYAVGINFAPGAAQATLGGNYCGPSVTVCVEDTSGTAIGQQLAPGRRYITAKLGAGTSIPDTTSVAIPWDVIGPATVGWGTTPSANVTVGANSPFIFVRCTGQAEFAANATGSRTAEILKNGILVGGASPALSVTASTGGLATDLNLVTGIIPVTGGDALTFVVSQNSGGALGLDPQLTWMQCEAVE